MDLINDANAHDDLHGPAPMHSEPIQIGDGHGTRRLAGLIGYLLFFVAVAAVLVVLFLRFTGSLRFAIALVGFMISYMAVAGWIAGRK